MKKYLVYGLFLFSVMVFSQEKDKNLPKGNDAFKDKKYAQAEAEYRVSESNNLKKSASSYNLGNSIYRQNQISEAISHYVKAVKKAKTKSEKHKAYHNLGNCLLSLKRFSQAAEAYKNALKNNPNDEQTRYNYALAKKQIKDEPPKVSDDKNKNKDMNQKENPKKSQGSSPEDQKNKQDTQNEREKETSKQDNNNKQKSGNNKQTLESMLDAVNNEEKKVQEKVNLQKIQGKPKETDKDW